MLLRVILCTCIVYQAVNANEGELEAYEGNPAVDYFWTTVRQTLLRFIDSWNLDNPANIVSRETLQEIWYPLERSIKDDVGSKSWMLINNHIKDTLIHPQGAKTLEKFLSSIHSLLLHTSFTEFKDLYKSLDKKGDAWENYYKLKALLIDELFKIQEDPQMRKSVSVIKNYIIGQIRKSLNAEDESSPTSKEDTPAEISPNQEKRLKKSRSKKHHENSS